MRNDIMTEVLQYLFAPAGLTRLKVVQKDWVLNMCSFTLWYTMRYNRLVTVVKLPCYFVYLQFFNITWRKCTNRFREHIAQPQPGCWSQLWLRRCRWNIAQYFFLKFLNAWMWFILCLHRWNTTSQFIKCTKIRCILPEKTSLSHHVMKLTNQNRRF